jgi:hypothetical protein
MKRMAAVLLVSCVAAHAGPPSSGARSGESEEEQMITEYESMGKNLNAAIQKIAEKLKASGLSPEAKADAKSDLEKIKEELERRKSGAPKAGGPGAPPSPTDQAANAQMLKTIQGYMQGLSSKVMGNVNESVDKMNKLSEEVE